MNTYYHSKIAFARRGFRIGATTLFLFFFCLSLQAQTVTVSGQVIDETGFGLPGVVIVIKGTTNGTSTDIDGNYSIDAEKGATLIYSFLGYNSSEQIVGEESTINIALEPSAEILDEVVVTGYGQTQNKRYVTTAITSISPKVLEDRPIPRLEQAIQGSAPSVLVLQESGSPGAPSTIRMRGLGTAGNATPLILVNGVQVPDMSYINAGDIQNITILKDAASSAIYGARGGNGVILIETRKGSGDGSGPSVTLDAYYGMQSLASDGAYLTSQEYAEYYNNSVNYLIRHELPINGRTRFTDEEIANLPETNWARDLSEDVPISNVHVGISGQTDNTAYFLSGGFFSQDGIIGKTSFDRLSFSIGLNTQLSEKIDVNFFSTFTRNDREYIFENSENVRLMNSIASLPPIYPVYDELGNPFNNGNRRGIEVNGVEFNVQPEFGNPAVGLENIDNVSIMDVLYSNAVVNYQIFNRIKFSAAFGYLTRENELRQFSARFDYPEQFIDNPNNFLFESSIAEEYKQLEGYFTIDIAKTDAHDLTLIAGTSVLDNNFYQASRSGLNFFPNTLEEVNFSNIISDDDKIIPNDLAFRNTTLSFYGRANYNINQKYLVTATVRADASSKFSESNRWGVFPSVALGWIISSEEFMANSGIFDLLKLRASWGVNGNDQIAPYQYADRYTRDAGSLIKLDFNDEIKWEEISQIDVGVDANLFGNKIGITLDYYIKETKDMLLNFPNPGFLGLPSPVRNAATVRNNGIEAVLLYRDDIGSDFKYTIGLNFGTFTNEITDLNGGLPIEAANTRVFNGAPNLTRTDEGHPIASFYGYVFDGLDDAGNPVYADLNNDGVIDPANDRAYIGNPFPDFIYGFNLGINYKNFDFTAFLFGSQGNDVVNAAIGYGVQYSNRTDRVLDAWTLENQNSQVMRPSALDVTNHDFSDYYIEDGSYLRVKNISIGYTLPVSVLDQIGIERLRVYASGNNLFTFTQYSGLDPEIGANNNPLDVGVDRGFYPLARTIMGGVQVSF